MILDILLTTLILCAACFILGYMLGKATRPESKTTTVIHRQEPLPGDEWRDGSRPYEE